MKRSKVVVRFYHPLFFAICSFLYLLMQQVKNLKFCLLLLVMFHALKKKRKLLWMVIQGMSVSTKRGKVRFKNASFYVFTFCHLLLKSNFGLASRLVMSAVSPVSCDDTSSLQSSVRDCGEHGQG